MTRLAYFLIVALIAGWSQPPAPHVSQIISQHRQVHWGIHAVQLRTGRVLASHNSHQFFIPASNTKLFSTAHALIALGPNHHFQTRVLAARPLAESGVLTGDLVLAGGGDPSLSSRNYPYNRDEPFAADRLAPLRALARQLYEQGLRHVTGAIAGDDSAYEFDPIPNGWAAGDGLFEYGAPVSALSYNDNTLGIQLTQAGVTLNPPVPYFQFVNEVTHDAAQPRRIRVERQPGSRTVTLRGNLPPEARPYENELAVDDPALYAATAFRVALQLEGIRVDGPAVARHHAAAEPETVTLALRESPPLPLLLQVVNKESQNLHAELMRRAASQVLPAEDFLKQAGIALEDTNFEDGSGLSRLTLVTPRAVVQLLTYLNAQGHYDLFRDLLPIGAEDGTLRNRFAKNPRGKLIRAKTGSLSHVSALGGYAESARYGPIAFQIVANNFNGPSQEVRSVIDRIALALVQ
jgi:D-alanyl-D-alanine carboxypeptidase/D-alanyl-D-alanine-endopeptidase (penicillin-binding protein 4)